MDRVTDGTRERRRRRGGLSRLAGYTWTRQWKAEIFTGMVGGISGLAGFAAMRSLGAPTWVPTLIAVAGQLLWIVAPGLETFTARLDPRRTILWVGIVANVPLLLTAFLPVTTSLDAEGHARGAGPWAVFLVGVIVLTALDAVYIPLRGALVRANYEEAIRGRVFGWLSAVSKVASMASAKASGLMLDMDARWIRVVFPFAGICGLIEHGLLARIRWHRRELPAEGAKQGFRASLREGWSILRRDRSFLTFEIGFLLYGLGFLMSEPQTAVFTERDLRLSYAEQTWAKAVAESVAYMAVALLVGRKLSKLGIVPVTAAAFLALSVYFVALSRVTTATEYALLSVLFGATMACVNLGWNLGPLRFAPAGKARAYAAVHLTMVGVRIAVGPLLGLAVSAWGGPRLCFGVSSVLVAAGAVTTWNLARRVR